jgi:hypothetical protein
MATSDRDDHEDREEKDEAAEGKSPEEKADDVLEHLPSGARAKGAKEKADEGDDEPDEDDDADEEPAEDKKPEPQKPAKAAPKSEPGKSGTTRAKTPPPKGGSLGKSMLLFVIIVGGLAAGFAILGREEQTMPSRPKWTSGQSVDVEITLVKNDKQDLACSSPDEINSKHCAFEANSKPWSKGDNTDDKKVLRPYTTTEHLQFAAAGIWSDPALAPDKLPATRFSVKCKYKVEGTLKSLGVRWEQTGQWFPNNEWFAGSVSDCKIIP